MKTPVQQRATARRQHSVRRGFTLAELVASMAIMVILMGAMTSVIVVASHALPDSEDPTQKKVAAMDVVDQIAGELFYATSITEETPNAVTFTVADRGHGAAGPETIRYEWSGTPRDPLTRQYNSGTVVKACEDVQLFELSYDKRVGQLVGPPRVLFLVADPFSITPQETARQTEIENWGFPVQVFPDHASAAEFDAALANCDVVYVGCESGRDVSPVIKNSSKGIVCEERALFPGLGISSFSNWLWIDSIDIKDNTHEITKPFSLGTLQIFNAQDYAIYSWGTIAPGGRILAGDTSGSYDILVALDFDAELEGGGVAPARRISMPWGDRGFDFSTVNADGLTLMRRAIVWAAAPVVYSGARIVLKPTADNERVRTEVQVFNTPEVNAP